MLNKAKFDLLEHNGKINLMEEKEWLKNYYSGSSFFQNIVNQKKL
jgi:hypothetical protein